MSDLVMRLRARIDVLSDRIEQLERKNDEYVRRFWMARSEVSQLKRYRDYWRSLARGYEKGER